ncbi:MAG: enoyl-CoA hydratase/isomerase family protein [Acidimicrobiales bacterium]
MTTPVLNETTDGVTTLTLADEANRNALGVALVEALREALAEANADPTVRAVVVTNTGTTFCAGANLKERAASDAANSDTSGFEKLLVELQTSCTPIVGKIRGHVVGGGMGLACALDIAIADAEVKFGFTEVRLGVAPAIISVVCLPRMSRGQAMEAFLRGNRFPASQAADLGLISRAVPAEQLDAEVDAVVDDLVRGGPQALATAKRLVNEVPAMGQSDAFRFTSALSAELFSSAEAAAGVRAFLAHEPAPWVPGSSR